MYWFIHGDYDSYLYDYDGYQAPLGIAWAPNKNLIAFIGGSFIFKDIYGVKWDSTGESIYYLVDLIENENMYKLYKTEIESNSYLLVGTVSDIIEIDEEGFNNWLNKKENEQVISN